MQVGPLIKALRERQRLSQMALALHTGVSQRHLSCLETGKAQPSRPMLLALLDAMGTSLSERNQALVAAGFAPHYPCSGWDGDGLGAVRATLREFLRAHEPAPAMLLDAQWNLLETNAAVPALMQLIGFVPAPATEGAPRNLLEMLLGPGGLLGCAINGPEVAQAVLRRAQAEAVFNPGLASRLQSLPAGSLPAPARHASAPASPVLLMQLRSSAGTLRFISAFTTLASPLDVTLDSLRMDHLLPADAGTRLALGNALAAAPPLAT
ncbi:MAG: helix-turn-helix domain-containing protein [Pseudomonadota bacterium]